MTKKKKDKLMIIDGNALIHRSFYALPPTMTTKNGEIVNAVFGFANFLFKAIKEIGPEYVVLTLDKKGPTFRHKEYKEYKANRVKAPDELYAQFGRVRELATAFDIPIFEKSGFEADDLIGTISRTVNSEVEKIVVTGDMDTLQLVNDHTKVYAMSRGISDSVLYDEGQVREKYDLAIDQLIDYKALRGDPSDNIPGVRGVGEKTAVILLKEFITLEKLYKAIEKDKSKVEECVKPRIVGLLEEYKEDAIMSKSLATIKCDVPIKFDLEKTRFDNFDQEEVVKLFIDLEFKSMLPRVKDLKNDKKTSKEDDEKAAVDKFERNKKQFKYNLIDISQKTGQVDFEKFLAELEKQKEFTFDTETSSFDPITANLLGISFSWKSGVAYYLNVENKSKKEIKNDLFNYQDKNKEIEETNPWLEKLKPIFENEKVKKYAHNGKFDIRVMRSSGIEVANFSIDSMIASYLLNPGSRQHNLDAVTFAELGFEKISKTDLLGKGRDKITFSEVETEKLSLYSCEDADFTNRLIKKLKPELKKQGLEKLFTEIEMPLVPILATIEDNGIVINKSALAKMSKRMTVDIDVLVKKIHKLAGEEFNISSPKQLKVVLFEKLEIPTKGIKKTKTGLSTAADELVKLRDEHEIIPLIQKYRELTKLTTTYIDALPELINKKTKRVHTSFNQTVTATGRLSSTEPNLQNIPVKNEIGREIRKAFYAPRGYQLMGLDYSQIELRLAAHMSGDKKMIRAFQESADIHSATAAEINQVKLKDVTKPMRRAAKATNFGILYGQGPHGLAQTAEITYWEAKEFIDKYFESYVGIRDFIESTIEKTKEDGYVTTLFDRRRYLPEINSSVAMIKKAAERMAVNTPLQGTAADMIKVAMIEVDKILDKNEIKMISQVHDELLFEVKSDKVEIYAKKIKKIMEEVIVLKVPIIVDVKAGDNWGELEQLSITN